MTTFSTDTTDTPSVMRIWNRKSPTTCDLLFKPNLENGFGSGTLIPKRGSP